jgi:hypothetical protein
MVNNKFQCFVSIGWLLSKQRLWGKKMNRIKETNQLNGILIFAKNLKSSSKLREEAVQVEGYYTVDLEAVMMIAHLDFCPIHATCAL